MTNQNIESLVWRCAYDDLGRQRFQDLLVQGLAEFKRAPGLDMRVRLHASDIGQSGVDLLREALGARQLANTDDDSLYVTLRSSLKTYLTYLLRSQLIATGYASEALLEHHLGEDLGL